MVRKGTSLSTFTPLTSALAVKVSLSPTFLRHFLSGKCVWERPNLLSGQPLRKGLRFQLMYDVIQKTHCCAKLRLPRKFSYISRQGIMRPACRARFEGVLSLFGNCACFLHIISQKGNLSFEPGSNRWPWDAPRLRNHYSPTLFQLSYRRLVADS